MPGVVCVGLTVLDVVHRVPIPPVWGRKHVASSAEMAVGGPAANAAICAARLLGSATLITGLGGSVAATVAGAELAAYGVHVVDGAPPDYQLPVAACIVDELGERTVFSPGALATTWGLPEAGREIVRGATVLLLDGHHPVTATQALAVAEDVGAPAVLDAGSLKAHAETWLGRLDVVVGSADYAAALGLALAQATEHVLAAGAGAAVMTDGAGPVLVRSAGEADARLVRPPSVRAVDTLGAGDAFHGALVAALAFGAELGCAVEVAVQVASTRVAHVGARAWLAEIDPLGGS